MKRKFFANQKLNEIKAGTNFESNVLSQSRGNFQNLKLFFTLENF